MMASIFSVGSPGRIITRRTFLRASVGGMVLIALGSTGCQRSTPAVLPSPLPNGAPLFPQKGCLHAAVISDQYPQMNDVTRYETLMGKKLAGSVWFHSCMDFALPHERFNALGARVPIVKWGWHGDLDSFVKELGGGLHDDDIEKMAVEARDWKKPMIVIPFYEPNDMTHPWSGHALGGQEDRNRNGKADGPDQYIQTFNRVASIFKKVGAQNVKFAWIVNWESNPKAAWNDLENYYPDQCDYVGFDFFNGAHLPVKPPEQIIKELVDRLRKYEKPILIGEVGVSEGGVNKSKWIREFFDALKKFPEIKLFVWFDEAKEADWQWASSDASLKAAQAGLQDPWIVEDFSVNP